MRKKMSKALIYYLQSVKKMHKALHTNKEESACLWDFNLILKRHCQLSHTAQICGEPRGYFTGYHMKPNVFKLAFSHSHFQISAFKLHLITHVNNLSSLWMVSLCLTLHIKKKFNSFFNSFFGRKKLSYLCWSVVLPIFIVSHQYQQ